MDRRLPFLSKIKPDNWGWWRNSARVIGDLNFFTSFTSTMYQRGFVGELLGSKCSFVGSIAV